MEKVDFSILIPAYNEEANIASLLKSIVDSEFGEQVQFEVTILPNGCTDNTTDVVNKFIRGNPNDHIFWKVIETENRQKSSALNLGLDNIRSEIVINLDADCRLDKKCLNLLYGELKENHELMVAGALDIPDFTGRERKELLYQFQKVHQIYREVRGRVLPVGRAMGYRKSAVGHFPPFLHSEDTWLALDVANRYGWGAVRVIMEAKVYFSPASNWLDYLKQESRFECGLPQILRHFPELERVFDDRRKGKNTPSAQEIEQKILQELVEEDIPQSRFNEMRDIIDPIIVENSQMLQARLIDNNGRWEPIISTKKFKTTNENKGN